MTKGNIIKKSEDRRRLLIRLEPKYLWWEFAGSEEERATRILAQVMDLGTYDDIQAVERLWSAEELARVLEQAQPGWLGPRSWSFWQGRLGSSAALKSEKHPPRRTFGVDRI